MNNNFCIDTFIQKFNVKCIKTQIKEFKKSETITTYLVNRSQLCILLDGEADLIRYDLNGNKNIIEQFTKNSLFGEIFYHTNTNNELFVIAKKNTKVLFFDYNFFYEKCKNKCPFHEELTNILPKLILEKITELNSHIELLSKRTTREKILLYFNNLATKNLSKTFHLNFSFTDLADYLGVDRSAMMREIKQLKEDKLIKKEGNKITLLTI